MKKLTDEGQDHEKKQYTGIVPKKLVHGRVEDGDGGDESGEHDLCGQNPIHLPYEAPAELVLAIAQPRV